MNFLDIVDFSKDIRDKKIADALEAKIIDLGQFKELLRQSQIVENHSIDSKSEKISKATRIKVEPKKVIKDETKDDKKSKVEPKKVTKDDKKSKVESKAEPKKVTKDDKKSKVVSEDEDPICHSEINIISKEDEEKYLTANQREKLPAGMKAGIIRSKKLKELSDSSSEENPKKIGNEITEKLSVSDAFQRFANEIRPNIQEHIKLENPTINPPMLVVETSKRINELWEKTSELERQSIIKYYSQSLLERQTWEMLKLICEKNKLNPKGFRKTLIERIESQKLSDKTILSQINEIKKLLIIISEDELKENNIILKI